MPYDDQSELFYLVDQQDQVLGSVLRGEAHRDREKIHRAVDILVLHEGKLLLQKRSQHKDTNPGYWSLSASGHVTFGQSYDEAAARELQEELGISLPITFLGKQLFDTGTEKEYISFYQATYDGSLIDFDQTEVSEVLWVSLQDLPKFVVENQVTPSAKMALTFLGYLPR